MKQLIMSVMTISSIVLSAVSPNYSLASEGGSDRGGGAGVCTESQCWTLAQAGLKIDLEQSKDFEIEQDVIEELAKIINQLPFLDQNSFLKMAIGQQGTFNLAQTTSSSNYLSYVNEYKKVLAKYPVFLNSFQLVAFSENKKTFLLPEYFKLNTTGKALLLMHETLIREVRFSLKDVLTFDAIVYEYLSSENKDITKLTINLYELLYNRFDQYELPDRYLIVEKKSDATEFYSKKILIDLFKRHNIKEIPFETLCSFSSIYGTPRCIIDRAKALELRIIDAAFSKYLSGAKFSFNIYENFGTKKGIERLKKANRYNSWYISTLESNSEMRPDLVQKYIDYCSAKPELRQEKLYFDESKNELYTIKYEDCKAF